MAPANPFFALGKLLSLFACAGLAAGYDRFPPASSLSRLAAGDGPSRSCGAGGICFSGVINHNAILQRAPARAAVLGSVSAASPAGAAVAVTLAGIAADGSAYSKTFDTTANADFTYKVLLDPMPAWGSFTVTASCAACAGTPTAVSVGGVTFGDVFVASGQSK